MKLNLSTNWTNKKIQTLLLLTLLSSHQVDSGSQFRQCFDINEYTTISNFASNIADKQLFCCDSNRCHLLSASASRCQFTTQVQCNKIGQSKFCVTSGGILAKSSLPSHLCGGILGDVPVADNIVGTCPSLQVIKDTLSSQSTSPTFSWLCCDDNTCTVPVNVGISSSIANTNCATNQYSLMCFQDNGGWSCTGNISPDINNAFRPIGDCVLQIVLPDSDITDTSGTTKTTSIVAKNTGDSKIDSSNDPHLTEKIVIPVGTIVGVATVSGVTYYFIRRRRKANQQIENRAAENQQFVQPVGQDGAVELNDIQQLRAENFRLQQQLENQTQVQVNPYYR